jgi:hypothetical protein
MAVGSITGAASGETGRGSSMRGRSSGGGGAGGGGGGGGGAAATNAIIMSIRGMGAAMKRMVLRNTAATTVVCTTIEIMSGPA